MATELTTEIRMKREYAHMEKERSLEDKMMKMNDLQKMSSALKRARYQGP